MEAIMIGGLAVVAIGGYYATVDFLHDIGFKKVRGSISAKRSFVCNSYRVASQSGIKKMAGMNI